MEILGSPLHPKPQGRSFKREGRKKMEISGIEGERESHGPFLDQIPSEPKKPARAIHLGGEGLELQKSKIEGPSVNLLRKF